MFGGLAHTVIFFLIEHTEYLQDIFLTVIHDCKDTKKIKKQFLNLSSSVYSRVGIYPTIAFAMFHNRATIRMCNFMSGKCETVNNANATHIYHIHILTIPYVHIHSTPTHIHISCSVQYTLLLPVMHPCRPHYGTFSELA